MYRATKQNKNYTFSIIVPTHNSDQTIHKCLNSLIEQQITPNQIIVIDDNSSDNTLHILNNYVNKYNFISLYKNKKSGVSSTRNIGLKYASSEIIGFCDADDYYEKNTLSIVNNLFLENPYIDIVCGGFNVVYNNTHNSRQINGKSSIIYNSNKMFEHVLLDSNIMGSCWNKFYKQNILKNIAFDESMTFCEDTLFNCTLLNKNKNIQTYISDQMVYNYVQHSNNATLQNNNLYTKNNKLKYIDALEKIKQSCGIKLSQQIQINSAICKLSAIHYNSTASNKKQKHLLLRNIRKYLLCMLFTSIFYKDQRALIKKCIYILYNKKNN